MPGGNLCVLDLKSSTVTELVPELANGVFGRFDVDLLPQTLNLGFGRANNLGIRAALDDGARRVLLLNQDACVLPDTIGRLASCSEAHPEYGILSPAHLYGAGEAFDPTALSTEPEPMVMTASKALLELVPTRV